MQVKRLFMVFVVLAFMSVGQLMAQDEIDLSAEIEEGSISINHPESWTFIVDPNGTIVLSNADIESISTGGEIPENAVFVQVIVAGINVLPFEDAPEVIDAQAVMEELTPPEVDLPIEAIEREDASPLAFVDQSNETDDGYVYVTMLDDETFGLVVTSAGAGQLEAQIPTILAMIDTLSVDFGVTLEEGAAERYADYTQSQSEDGYPQLGEEDAPVVVVEISSFDCPACRFFHDEVFPLILERVEAGEVLFQYVPVYVYGTGGIPAGDAAARATFCASEQDAFWPYHDLIFDWQEFGQLAFSGTRLANGAEALGLDTEAFAECMASERPDEYLDAVLEYAFGLEEFAGTPTVFVNGEQVSNSAEAIINLIDSQLADSE